MPNTDASRSGTEHERRTTVRTPLVNREPELARLRAFLSGSSGRLLTITGPPGCGKTRMGLASVDIAAASAADTAFVALDRIRDANLVPHEIAQAIGAAEASGQSALDALLANIHDRSLLLVLDNFEHVLDAGPVVGQLLSGCPNLRVLVTSRARLHLHDESILQLEPLTLPAAHAHHDPESVARSHAVQLLVQRIQAFDPSFSVSPTTARPVAMLCEYLEGLPLAIELVAARLRIVTPEMVVEGLGTRLALLANGALDLPPRHQTMRSAIAWSYDLLSPEQQHLFRYLGIVAGGCTIDAAREISGMQGVELLDGLAALLDVSLLRSERVGNTARYQLLEVAREFAVEQLDAHDERAECEKRHRAHFIALAETAELKLGTVDEAQWLLRLDAEQGNLRVALGTAIEAGLAEDAHRLAGALGSYWAPRGRFAEGRAWLRQTLALGDVSSVLAAKVLISLGQLTFHEDVSSAIAYLQQGRERARDGDDATLMVRALIHLSHAHYNRGEATQAVELIREAESICLTTGNRNGLVDVYGFLAAALMVLGDLTQAKTAAESSIELGRRIANHARLAFPLYMHGYICAELGELDIARVSLNESLTLYQAAGMRWESMQSLFGLGEVARKLGDIATARHLYLVVLEQTATLDAPWALVYALERVAYLAVEERQAERAARLFGSAAALSARLGIVRPAAYEPDYQQYIGTLRTMLTDEAFAAAWWAGEIMTDEDVIVFALQVDGAPVTTLVPASRSSEALPAGSALAGNEVAPMPHQVLTKRQSEVLILIAQGLSNRDIGVRLNLSEKTVERHVANIYARIGVENRAGAAAFAFRAGLM
jgi:predicted ATPase/DNA-binding CsgD family transcriptional regulator